MGTLINAVSIVIATFFGVILKKGLPERIQKAVMFAMGLALAVLATGWFLRDYFSIDQNTLVSEGDLLVIISLVIGALIGEWIDIDARLNSFAQNVEKRYNLPPLAKGFVAGTLIFCVGAMAIIGSIQDGLHGDYTILIVKSALDFITAMMLAAVLGIGVAFSAISVIIYQGSITLLAMLSADILTDSLIRALSMVGNILIIGIGIQFMNLKQVKVANLLPALLVPIVYAVITAIF